MYSASHSQAVQRHFCNRGIPHRWILHTVKIQRGSRSTAQQQMEVSGQHHALAALVAGKNQVLQVCPVITIIIIIIIWHYNPLWVSAFSAKSLQVLLSLAIFFRVLTFSFFRSPITQVCCPVVLSICCIVLYICPVILHICSVVLNMYPVVSHVCPVILYTRSVILQPVLQSYI